MRRKVIVVMANPADRTIAEIVNAGFSSDIPEESVIFDRPTIDALKKYLRSPDIVITSGKADGILPGWIVHIVQSGDAHAKEGTAVLIGAQKEAFYGPVALVCVRFCTPDEPPSSVLSPAQKKQITSKVKFKNERAKKNR
jgi:hypothetical protein